MEDMKAVTKQNQSSEIVSNLDHKLGELMEAVNDICAFRNRIKGCPPESTSEDKASVSPVKPDTLEGRLRDFSGGFTKQLNRLNEVLSSLKQWA